MLEVRKLHSGYSGTEVLHGVSLVAQAGKITVVIGPNGCGKSTLLRAICGINPAKAGQVLLDGKDLLKLPRNLLAQKIAYLPQNRQIPDITVERLVLHGRFPYLNYPRRYRQTDYEAAARAMEQMNLTDLTQTPLNRLSGGQQQRAYIAMALAQDTPVILLDEPTAYLDISYQLQLMQQARNLARQGKTVLMVIHDLPRAMQTADALILMECGSIAFQGTPEELFRSGGVNRVFDIRLGRAETNGGWQYYCEEV